MINRICIFDLDGTLSLCEHRLKYIKGEKKDWNTFFKECINDEVNEPVAELLRILWYDYLIVIISGRSEDVKSETETWLKKYDIPYVKLFMRPHNNFTSDDILKQELMKKAQKELNFDKDDVLCIFDDRSKVVEMWRDLGYTCFQVRKGDY